MQSARTRLYDGKTFIGNRLDSTRLSSLLQLTILVWRFARGIAGYHLGHNYSCSKSRACDGVKVTNFDDARVMLDEEEKAAHNIANNELNASSVEPSQAAAVVGEGVSPVVLGGKEVYCSIVSVSGESEEGHTIESRCRQSVTDVCATIYEDCE